MHRALTAKDNPLSTLEEMLQRPRSEWANSKDWDKWDVLTAPPPQVTPFEAALYYFQTRISDLAKKCAHGDCPAPFFIAAKRSQKFCSEACAGPANREAKRKWWHDNRGKGEAR